MKLAILSGKGGTGKTTLSTNLHYLFKETVLIDADIEEPNSHIFLNAIKIKTDIVKKEYPVVNYYKCQLCGKCDEICAFNAILPTKDTILIFKENCHECGGCEIVCKFDAINYQKREIGKIYEIETDINSKFIYGKLNIGEPSGVNIIKKLKKITKNEKNIIIDCPPGTSCNASNAVENSDYALIVVEPTPFGVSDMKLVILMLKKMNIPFGIIVNKSGIGNDEIYKYCKKENIEILGEIPFSKEIAFLSAKGEIIANKIKSVNIELKKIVEKAALGCTKYKNKQK